MKVTIGSDHGGFNLKEEIKSLLEEMKIEYNDVGTYQAEAIDYPEVSGKVAKSIFETRRCRWCLWVVLYFYGFTNLWSYNKKKPPRA